MGTQDSEIEVSRVGVIIFVEKYVKTRSLRNTTDYFICSKCCRNKGCKARKSNKRGPRLFFVTTESSTLTTTTMCWSITRVGCTGLTGGECRRRRSISEDFDSDGLEDIDPTVSRVTDIDSSLNEEQDINVRQGRQNNALNWLLYWATTTLTTTSFSTTKTLTIPLPAGCTPAGMSCCSA